MKIFGYNISKEKEQRNCEPQYVSTYSEALNFSSIFNQYNSMNLSAVYRATELISDSIAVLPIKVKLKNGTHKDTITSHPLNLIFEDKSGAIMSKYNLIKMLIQSVILKGNGYAYVKRANDGTPTSLIFLESKDVQVHYNKNRQELYYTCSVITQKKIEPINMVHLVKNSYNGVEGISVLSYASRTLNLANSTENAANSFYESGCNLAGILKVQGQLSDKQRTDIRTSWNNAYTNGGSGIAILQGNMDYQSIQLNSKDAQMLESRLFNVSDIARFFGISPVLLGDLTHSSYSTLEAAQNEFLVHTLQPYIVMVEAEFSRKLLLPSESNLEINLDETYLLRTDKTAQAQYYQTLLNCGILCINEVRSELGYSEIEGGDKHCIPFTDINQNNINNSSNKDDKEV